MEAVVVENDDMILFLPRSMSYRITLQCNRIDALNTMRHFKMWGSFHFTYAMFIF